MCIEQGIELSWWKTVRISSAQASKVLVVWFWKFDVGALVLRLECVCMFGFEVGVGFGERVIDR